MKIKVTSYFFDAATNAQREFGVELDDADGLEIFGEAWNTLPFSDKCVKLRGTAEVMGFQYALSRDLISSEIGMSKIRSVIKSDLK